MQGSKNNSYAVQVGCGELGTISPGIISLRRGLNRVSLPVEKTPAETLD
jgi:hypothetical protein